MADAIILGVTRWKRSSIRPFIVARHRDARYRRVSRRAVAEAKRDKAPLYVWAAREEPWLADAAREAGLSLTRIEDGFLRGVGLGSNFRPALSLVFDAFGIYFDSSRESGIERILADPAFPSPELRAQAQQLRARLVDEGMTKYNVKNAPRPAVSIAPGKRIILVPGQVEDDASIKRGSPRLKRNLDLIAAVRASAPEAIVLYKPHPDVESGNRIGKVSDSDARRYADDVLSDWDTLSALALATEVHTMTSLLGVEALLRGKSVTTYGLPFYAGLGLTTDALPWPRPRRAVDLDTLIAAAFLAYPVYRDPERDTPVTAFDVLDIIRRQREAAPPPRESPLTRGLRWLYLSLRA